MGQARSKDSALSRKTHCKYLKGKRKAKRIKYSLVSKREIQDLRNKVNNKSNNIGPEDFKQASDRIGRIAHLKLQ